MQRVGFTEERAHGRIDGAGAATMAVVPILATERDQPFGRQRPDRTLSVGVTSALLASSFDSLLSGIA